MGQQNAKPSPVIEDELEEQSNLTPMEKALKIIEKYNEKISEGVTNYNLNLSNLGLEEIPEIPESVEYLKLNNNYITELKNLPKYLKNLNIYNNHLTDIKELPKKLVFLTASYNQIEFIESFPKYMESIDINNNKLKELPILPENLEYLYCKDNQLETLPKLPQSLAELKCYNNNIKTLPELPANLKMLNCVNNLIENVPKLPKNIEISAVNNPAFDKYYEVKSLDENNIKVYNFRDEDFNTLRLPKGTVLFKSLKKIENIRDAFVGYRFKENFIVSAEHESYFFLHPFNTGYGTNTAIFVLTENVELILGLNPSKDYNKDNINEKFGQDCKIKVVKSNIKNKFQNYCINENFIEKYPNILGWIAPDDKDVPWKHLENKNFLKYYKYVSFYKNVEGVIARPEVSIYPYKKRELKDIMTPVKDFDGDWIIKNQDKFNYKLVTILDENMDFKLYKNLIDELLSKKGHKFGDQTYHMVRNEIDGMYMLREFL